MESSKQIYPSISGVHRCHLIISKAARSSVGYADSTVRKNVNCLGIMPVAIPNESEDAPQVQENDLEEFCLFHYYARASYKTNCIRSWFLESGCSRTKINVDSAAILLFMPNPSLGQKQVSQFQRRHHIFCCSFSIKDPLE